MSCFFANKAKKVDQVENQLRPVQLNHPEFNMRGQIERTDKANLVARSFHLLGNFERDHGSEGVPYENIRAMGLFVPDGLPVNTR